MEPALLALALVVTVGVVAGACRRFGWSPPPVLVVVGIAASYLPFVPEFELDPELVLLGLLPPLLYAAAIRTSLIDFRANTYAILLLSVGAIVVSTLAVGLVAWWIIPGVSLAAAIALGAVVAPPDAVAATAIARKVGMPRRIVTILEGESLVNDATALVALSVSITAITGSVGALDIGWEALRAAGGGLVIGVVVAQALSFVRARIDDPVLDTLLSFTAPFVAFLPAEAIHSSGVLAVVVTGLLLGHRAPVLQSATSRINETVNWRTVQFMLENAVFLLIGLQLRTIVRGRRSQRHRRAAAGADLRDGAAGGRAGALRLRVRLAGGPSLRRPRGCAGAAGPPARRPSSRGRACGAWSPWPRRSCCPAETPRREVLLLAAFTVVAGTLLVLSPTLPWLVRRLGLAGPDAAEDALQAAALADEASRAGLARLDEIVADDDPPEIVDDLRRRAARRPNALWERLGRANDELEPPSAAYARLRLQMLRAERGAIVERRDSGSIDDEVLREALAMVDREESLLDRLDGAQAVRATELVAPARTSGDCAHLRTTRRPRPRRRRPAPARSACATAPGGCTCACAWTAATSVAATARWGAMPTAHFHETSHPVMRSVEPGEAWRWCYVDEHLG